MKKNRLISASIFILAVQIFATAQTFDSANFLEEVQTVARKTAYQYYLEFTHNSKTKVETQNGKLILKEYEGVCSQKRCEIILVSENGKRFSSDKIKRNREKAAKNLLKSDTDAENPYLQNEESRYGYGTGINSYISPNLYLKYCRTDFIDKTVLNGRSTIKVNVTDCNADALYTPTNFKKDSLHFMSKTEGFIWIDEQDKAITKMELYAKKEFDNPANPNKPLIIIETVRVPEGYWFWKQVKINALENKIIFPEYVSSWQIDYSDYRKSSVDINKAEVDKK